MEWVSSNVRSPFSDCPTGISPDRVCRPSEMSATICLEVYASFEFQPMLGAGEQLRKLTITVEQLLNRGAKHVREWDGVSHKGVGTHTMAAFTFLPKDGDVVSPCSSVLLIVERRTCENTGLSASRAIYPHYVRDRLVSVGSPLIGGYS
jgi:hypothetical protein